MAIDEGRDDWPRGIVLVGYRGTGKSTVGRLLARLGRREFADADEVLEGRIGRSIAAVFADEGEGAFRELERETLAELTRTPGLVIATGGGAVLRGENREAMRGYGLVVWLAAGPGTIVDRLRRDPGGRPALTSAGLLDEVAAVLAHREPFYREAAHLVVETDDRPAERVAEAVLDRFATASLAGDP